MRRRADTGTGTGEEEQEEEEQEDRGAALITQVTPSDRSFKSVFYHGTGPGTGRVKPPHPPRPPPPPAPPPCGSAW